MIPAELRTRQQWVVWRAQKRAGKLTKVPYQAENPSAKASVTNPNTWSSYGKAKQTANLQNVAGVGFVFTDDDPYCGIDFDDAVHDGHVDPDIHELVLELATYTEYSPSGNGLHCIGQAEMKAPRHKGHGIEVYDRGRFFCVTEKRFRGTPTRIKPMDLSHVLAAIQQGENGVSQPAQPKQGSRHPALVSLGAQLLAGGTPRDVIEEALRARAGEIGLPSRERDEVGRIVEWLFQSTSLDNRIARFADQEVVKHHGKQTAQERLFGRQAVTDDTYFGDEELALPDEEITYVIDQIMPDGTNVLFSAERKSGKTRMALTLVKALVDGTSFLNSFAVDAPTGKVLYVNYELTRSMFRRWAKQLELAHPERLIMMHKKGGNFHFWLPAVRSELAEFCKEHDVWCIVFDTQLMAMVPVVENENDNMQVTTWQFAVDQLKKEAEVENCIILHHTGKVTKDRGRGASQIEAWPDVLWYMEKEEDGARTFWSEGREADIERIALSYNKETETYFWDGASKVEERQEIELRSWLQALCNVYESMGEWPGSMDARDLLTGRKSTRAETMSAAAKQGLVVKVPKKPNGYRIEVTDVGREFAGR